MSGPKIKGADAAEKSLFDAVIDPYTYTIGKDTTAASMAVLIVRAPKDDRARVKSDLESKLKSSGISFTKSTKGGGTGSTELKFGNKKIRVTYKPTSGGMSETTLNATITELAPSIAFMQGKRSFLNITQYYEFLVENASGADVYVVPRDKTAGINFVESMPNSSKFKDKMENAMAILDYLWTVHDETPIKKVYWGYRAKPTGINGNHKGDCFLEFENGNWLGVSLKAGGANTAEPQLNTYVNKMYDDFGRRVEKTKLINKVHKKIHGVLGLPKDWNSRTNMTTSINFFENLKVNDIDKYESFYDDMLEICRDAIIDQINSSLKDTLKYIKSQVIKKDEKVPLVVIKAFGKQYKYVTDEDALETHIPKVDSVNAYKSRTSKQTWHIDLIAGSEKLTMNMSVRSNKSQPNNKLAQGFNLAVKFNGLD